MRFSHRLVIIVSLLFFLIGISTAAISRPNIEIILKGGWGHSPIDSYYSFPSNSFVLGGDIGVRLNRSLGFSLGFNHTKKANIVYDDILGKPLFYRTVELLSINSQVKLAFNKGFWATRPYIGGGIGIHRTNGETLGLVTGSHSEYSTLFPSFIFKTGLETPIGIPRFFAIMEGELEIAPVKVYRTEGYNPPQSEGAKIALSLGLGLQI
ncbi:hypothetical protein IIA15_02755 [candidate division TA06 bacterium]|nr:hypothetical protein [candidate division TA06 bacterium]